MQLHHLELQRRRHGLHIVHTKEFSDDRPHSFKAIDMGLLMYSMCIVLVVLLSSSYMSTHSTDQIQIIM